MDMEGLKHFNREAKSLIFDEIEYSTQLNREELIENVQQKLSDLGKRFTNNDDLNIKINIINDKINSYTVYDGKKYVMTKDIPAKDEIDKYVQSTIERNYNEALMEFESKMKEILEDAIECGHKTIPEINDIFTAAYQNITQDTDNQILLCEDNRHISYALTYDNDMKFYHEEDYTVVGLVPEDVNTIFMDLKDEMMSSEEWENKEREEDETSL